MTKKTTEPIIDWEPAPGYVLCKPMKREEMAALYNRAGGSNLSLPDRVGKVSDSVGTGRIVKAGPVSLEYAKLIKELDITMATMHSMQPKPGDYIAWMPYTDQLIEIDGQKYSLVGYDKIRAVRKGESQ